MTLRLASLARLWDTQHILGASALYVCERALTAFVTFVVMLVLTRAYSPKEFGAWSYALTVVQIAAPFLAAGAEPIVVRELVSGREEKSEILGTSAAVLGVTGVVASVLPLCYLIFFNSDKSTIFWIAALASIASIPSCFLVLEHLLRAEGKPVPIVSARMTSTVAGGSLKIALSYAGYPLIAIAAILPLEMLVIVLRLYLAVRRLDPSSLRWRFNGALAKRLLFACLPSMISGVAVTIFFRINYLLVAAMAGFEQVAFYALAFGLLQMVVTFPGLSLSAVYPRLVGMSVRDPHRYSRIVSWLFFGGSLLGYLSAAIVALAAHYVVPVVFGMKYAGAEDVLALMFLSMAVMISGSVRALVINIQMNQVYHLWSALAGIVALVPASFILIPHYGAKGAAAGVLIGSLVSAVATSWILPNLRAIAPAQIRGLLLIPPRGYLGMWAKMRDSGATAEGR